MAKIVLGSKKTFGPTHSMNYMGVNLILKSISLDNTEDSSTSTASSSMLDILRLIEGDSSNNKSSAVGKWLICPSFSCR